MRLIEAAVCLLAARRVQPFVSTVGGMLHNYLYYAN